MAQLHLQRSGSSYRLHGKERTHPAASNPWSSHGSALGVNVGDPARVLTYGRKHDLFPASSVEEMERYAEQKSAATASVKMINTLQDIANFTKELHELELLSHRLALDQETADLTHIEQLETKLAHVDKLLTHLSGVMEGKDVILHQLQTSTVKNSLKIAAPYQIHAHSVFKSLGDFVTSLPTNLSTLEWMQQFQLDKTQLEERLSHGEKTLSRCQDIHQTLLQLHQAQKKCSESLT